MSFCTNCGTPFIKNAKFCPACGANLIVSKMGDYITDTLSDDKNMGRKIVPKPEKGRANNLFKKQTQDFIKEKAQSFIKEQTQEFVKKNISQSEKPTKPSELNNKTSKKLNKWTWIYVIINALLMYVGSQSEEVLGVLFFSFFILLAVFIRRKKEKPYNWLVKIIMIIQLVLLVALIVENIEYISILTLLFIGLLVTNSILLFKGNNT